MSLGDLPMGVSINPLSSINIGGPSFNKVSGAPAKTSNSEPSTSIFIRPILVIFCSLIKASRLVAWIICLPSL
jgi:hypothetical protein